MRRSAEAAGAALAAQVAANQEERTSSLAKTGKITAAGSWAGADAARLRGDHS
jgi:hypothetical protein